MNSDPHTVHKVRNATRRPVELHLGDDTVVLLPGEVMEVAADDPYCGVLLRRGVLTRHALAPAATGPAPKARSARKKAVRKAGPQRAKRAKTAADETAATEAAPKRRDSSSAHPSTATAKPDGEHQ